MGWKVESFIFIIKWTGSVDLSKDVDARFTTWPNSLKDIVSF